MTKRPDIRKMLMLSTGHVTWETSKLLDDPQNPWVMTSQWGTYGWFVYAHDDNLDEMPGELAHIMRYARVHGCEYILFDCDADVIDDLPVFQWPKLAAATEGA